MNKDEMKELHRIFIYGPSDNKEIEIKQIIRAIAYKFHVFNFENIFEIYDPEEYLPGPISLKNAIEFHCRMSSKKFEDFLEFFCLQNHIDLYGNFLVRDVPWEIKKLISVLLYLYLNKVCVFHGFNLLVTIDQMKGNKIQKEIFNQHIDKLNMVYVQPENVNTNHYMNVHQYFNTFAVMNKKTGTRYFSNKDDFSSHLE